MNNTQLQKYEPANTQLGRYWSDPEWQRVWLATQEIPWRSLAILPATGDLSSWEVARALLDVGTQHRVGPIVVADLRTMTLNQVSPLIDEVQRRVDGGEKVLIALSSVDANPAAAHVAKAADRTLLCVRLGSTPLREAKATIQMIGKERILGMVALRASGEPANLRGAGKESAAAK